MAEKLRIGIIGANARGGWAADSHVPAVQGLDGLELAAIATSRQDTADEAAHAFGVSKAYAGGDALIADPEIDIVTVATRVPDHRALVMVAIAAGKHVYSEWPLGRGAAESEEMAQAAKAAGVHHVIGLQLRASPAVLAARARLASGALGRVLSLNAFSTTAGFGPDVPAPFVYLEDPEAFANLVTIQGAHTLDLVTLLGGAPPRLSALASRQFPQIHASDEAELRPRTTFDHLLVQGSPRRRCAVRRWRWLAVARARPRSGWTYKAKRAPCASTAERRAGCSRGGLASCRTESASLSTRAS